MNEDEKYDKEVPNLISNCSFVVIGAQLAYSYSDKALKTADERKTGRPKGRNAGSNGRGEEYHY